MIARSKPNVDYNFLWECICGKGQQIDNTISNSFFFNSGASSLLFFLNLFGTCWNLSIINMIFVIILCGMKYY